MNLSEVYARVKRFGVPAFRTADAAAGLGISMSYASHALSRLARQGLLFPLKSGLWVLDTEKDPLALVEQLAAPHPAYISLQTALYHHGMISQVPSVIYAVSLAKTRRVRTPIGTYSMHHTGPEFFAGFEPRGPNQPGMATPEKAILDILYFRQNQPRLFGALPELELPRSFSRKRCERLIARIPSQRRRAFVRRGLQELLGRFCRPTGSKRQSGKLARPVS